MTVQRSLDDGAQRRFGVEGPRQHDPATGVEEIHQERAPRARVEERREDRRDIPIRQPPTGRSVDAVPQRLPLRDDRALRLADRARGVEDAVGIIAVQGRPLRLSVRRAGQFVLVRQRTLDLRALRGDDMRHLHLGPQLRQDVRELRPADQHHRLAIVDDISQLVRGQPPVQRRKDRADLRQAVEQINVDRAVVGQDRDPIALLHPQALPQEVRQPVRPRVQLAVGEPLPRVQIHQRLAVGGQVGAGAEKIGDVHGCLLAVIGDR